MTPRTWSEDLVFLDGHIHDEAKDCLHRPLFDACRVCCPHDDDPRIAEPEPEDSDWRVEVKGPARALVIALLASVGVAAVLVVLSVLTLAGVIPS